MIIFGSILITFESSSVFGDNWGSIENWIDPKTKPPSGNFACPNLRNALYDLISKCVSGPMSAQRNLHGYDGPLQFLSSAGNPDEMTTVQVLSAVTGFLHSVPRIVTLVSRALRSVIIISL